jgi:hypothetical protein
MADVELPDLPAVVAIADSDLLHVRQGVEDKKSTVATLEVHLDTKYLRQDDNLLSLTDDAAARANLGVLSESEGDAKYLEELNNLSDLTNTTVARNNLGLGTLATQNEGTGGPDFRDNDANDARYLLEANNLSDLTNVVTARSNLGLGTAAVVNTGTGASDVPTTSQADARYLLESNNLSDVTSPATAYNNIKQPATTSSLGAVEKATPAEMASGASDKFPDAATINDFIGTRVREWTTVDMKNPTLHSQGRMNFIANLVSWGFVFFNEGQDAIVFGRLTSPSNVFYFWEVSLGTSYDLSTSTLTQTYQILNSSSSMDRLLYKPDGTKLYVMSQSFIYQYDLSTPWDISTITENGIKAVGVNDLGGMNFNEDGTRLYSVGTQSSLEQLSECTLSTPWDINTIGTPTLLNLESGIVGYTCDNADDVTVTNRGGYLYIYIHGKAELVSSSTNTEWGVTEMQIFNPTLSGAGSPNEIIHTVQRYKTGSGSLLETFDPITGLAYATNGSLFTLYSILKPYPYIIGS